MTYAEIIAEIDQLHGEIIDTFGKDSFTAALAKRLYVEAVKEKQLFEEQQKPEQSLAMEPFGPLSDEQEYELAHAADRIRDARALSRR